MKNLIVILVMILSVLSCKDEPKQLEKNNHKNHITTSEKEEAPKKKVLSPHKSAMAMIGDAHIHIDYSSPGVRDRVVFGGLVGYNNVWQAGAHMATWIETDKDLVISGKVLPKGKYGFFTIPTKSDWTIMINKNWDQHGKDEYDEKEDVIRFNIIPEILNDSQEHLEYKVAKTSDNSGVISMSWEKVKIEFPFDIN